MLIWSVFILAVPIPLGSSPFTYKEYIVAVRTEGDGPLHCYGDKTSRISITNSTLMTINTCLSGKTYVMPFNGVSVAFVDGLSPEMMGSIGEKGMVALLSHIGENPRFYIVVSLYSVIQSPLASLFYKHICSVWSY